VVYELIVPYSRGDILASVHREGEVVSIGDGAGDDGQAWLIRARLSDESAGRLSEFVAGKQGPDDATPPEDQVAEAETVEAESSTADKADEPGDTS
jgi:hypothetical protein